MPYIPKFDRLKYDSMIEGLAKILNGLDDNDQLSGDMNYVLFRLAMLLTHEPTGGKRKYARMAVVLSAMGEAGEEFRRRFMGPYENEAIDKNGDIELRPQTKSTRADGYGIDPSEPKEFGGQTKAV